MLQPKKTKFRKAFKGRIHGTATSGATLAFGQFGLKALEPERVTARQIEAARRALTRFMKRAGRVWIRVYPDVPVSKKPIEVRMGKGKGTPEFWVVPRQAGPHPVRSRRHHAGDRQGSAHARGRQAAGQNPIHRTHRRVTIMKSADARAMTLDQLDDEVLKLKKEQFNLRFQRATGQLENTSRVRVIRRDIARMKTIAGQKRGGREPVVKAGATRKHESGRKSKTRSAKSAPAGKPPCALSPTNRIRRRSKGP